MKKADPPRCRADDAIPMAWWDGDSARNRPTTDGVATVPDRPRGPAHGAAVAILVLVLADVEAVVVDDVTRPPPGDGDAFAAAAADEPEGWDEIGDEYDDGWA